MNWLDRPGPWGMTVHEWLACLCASPSGGFGWAMILTDLPWTGFLLLLFALFLRSMVLGEDISE